MAEGSSQIILEIFIFAWELYGVVLELFDFEQLNLRRCWVKLNANSLNKILSIESSFSIVA